MLKETSIKRLIPLWLLSVVITVIFVEIIVIGMDILLMGQVTWDYIVTAFVAAVPASGIANFMVTILFSQKRELLLLNKSLESAELQAKAANTAKSEFLANMSHEIRTPLNGILGIAQLLERESLTPDQTEMVTRIRQSGRSLLAIINDILDFSKIEAGQLRIEPQPFRLEPLLFQIGNLLGANANAKGIHLGFESAPTIAGTLIGDPLRLEQVLFNLVGNAIKFTGQGEVRVRVLPLLVADIAVRLRFEVKDTGIGISADHVASLFQPFSQADAGITRRFGGTGLGLSISKRLVELMGGEIGVNSEAGVGSTFWFELPFERSTETQTVRPDAPPAAASPELRLAGLHLLVVDDIRINRFIVQRMLSKEGAMVSEAADGQQALDYLRTTGTERVDAVLMDIQMPVMDGLTATRAIREELRLTDLPVIALTAGVLPEERQAALESGINDLLPKPLDLDRMTAMIRHYCPVRIADSAT